MAESVQDTTERVEETVDVSAVDAALSPKSDVRGEADPDIYPGFEQAPY